MATTPSLAAAIGQGDREAYIQYQIQEALRQAQSAMPSPEVRAQQRGLLAQIPAGLAGAAVGAAALPFRSLSAFPGVRTVTEPIAEAIERAGPVPGPGMLEQGIRATGTSLGALGLAALAAPVTGVAAIPLTVGGLFGTAQLAETRGRLEKLNAFLPPEQRLSSADIYTAAIGAGGVEAIGETAAAFLLQGRFFPKTSAGISAAREYVVGRLLPEGTNKILQAGGRVGEEYVRSLAREVPTEIGQAAGQTAIERATLGPERLQALQQAGAPGVPPTVGEAAAAVVGPTAVASALIPGGVALARRVTGGRPQPMTTAGGQAQRDAITQQPAAQPVIPPTTQAPATAAPSQRRPLPFAAFNPLTGEGVESTQQRRETAVTPTINPLTGEQELIPADQEALARQPPRQYSPAELFGAQFPTIPPEVIQEALRQTPDVLQQRLSQLDQMLLERGYGAESQEDVQPLVDRQEFYEALLQQHFRLTSKVRPLPFSLPVQTQEDMRAAQAAEAEAVQRFAAEQQARSQGLPVQALPAGPSGTRSTAEIEAQIAGTAPLPSATEAALRRRGIPLQPPGQAPTAAQPPPQAPLPEPVVAPAPPVSEAPGIAAAPPFTQAAPQPGEVRQVPTTELVVDPERFQYKRGATAKGTTGSLSGVETFDPMKAGVVHVWRDPNDGRTYVVNGHNRVALAQRANAPVMNVMYLDAPTAEKARGLGAMINIAEGRGTAVDAAKFIRDAGLTLDDLQAQGIPLREKVASDGLALSKLNPSLFGMVSRDEFPVGRAVIIGELVPDAAGQYALVNLLEEQQRRGKRLTDDVVRELAEMVRSAPAQTTSELTLFGTEESTRSLAVERARLVAAVRRRLASDERLFGTVGRPLAAQRLAHGGNIIDIESSQSIATQAREMLAIFDRLKNSSGSISELLNTATTRIAGGENAQKVTDDLYRQLSEEIRAVVGRGQGDVVAASPVGTELFATPTAAGEAGGQPAAPVAEQPAPSPVPPAAPSGEQQVGRESPGVIPVSDIRGMLGGIGPGIAEAGYDNLWSLIQAGKTSEAGAPSAFLQVAKRIRDAGGEVTREGLPALYAEYASVSDLRGARRREALSEIVARHTRPAEQAPSVEQQLTRAQQRANIEQAYIAQETRPGDGATDTQSIRGAARRIGALWGKIQDGTWHTRESLRGPARRGGQRGLPVEQTHIDFLRAQGALQTAWDAEGNSYYAGANTPLRHDLSQDPIVDEQQLGGEISQTEQYRGVEIRKVGDQFQFTDPNGDVRHAASLTGARARIDAFTGALSVIDANRAAGQGPVTPAEVRRLYRGQQVEVLEDGTIRVHMPAQGAVVDVVNMTHISPSVAELELSTGQTSLAPGQAVVGRATPLGQGLFRIEVTEGRTAETFYHETEHVFEDMGLLTAQDIETLNRTLQRQARETTAENRADLLAARLNANTRDVAASPLMRVVRKIQQFLDRLARLAGIRTTGQIVRQVQSGAIFQREGAATGAQPGQLSTDGAPHPLVTAAIQIFGTTTNPRGAGYLLPDGTFLDFSSTHPGRLNDHRMIGQVFETPGMQFYLEEIDEMRGLYNYSIFLKHTGALRWAIDDASLQIEGVPTFSPSQQRVILQTIRQEGLDEVLVDRLDPQTGDMVGASRFLVPGDLQQLRTFLRPAQGRLQVVDETQEQQALPGLEPPTPPMGQQAATRQVPPATPRKGATYRTELKSLLEYAAVANAMTPNQIAYLQQRNDEGHAFFEKPVVPVMYVNEKAREIREEWRRDPNARALFMQRLAGPESATMPRGSLASGVLALQQESLELWDLHYSGLQAGAITPEYFAEFEAGWEASNAMIHYATNTVSEAARVLRMQREDVTGQAIYQKKHRELMEYYQSGKLTDAQKAEFERQLREAFASNNINALADLRITPPTLSNYWWELYYSWLYNVQTWNTNLWTTTGYQLFHQGLVEPLAAGIDRVASRVGQREQQIYADVALRTFTENMRGAGRAIQHAWWLWRGDPRAENIPLFHRTGTPMRRDVAESVGAWERSPHAWMRAAAPWITATSRGLDAGDVAMRENVFNARMRAMAEQASRQELGRLDEDWMRDWQQTQVREQTDVFGEVLDYSKELTFHAPMSQVGELIIKKPREMPYGLGFLWRTLFPFAQTPDNLIRRGLELLPLNPVIVGSWYFKPETLKWAGWLPYPGREAFTPEASMMFAKQMIGTMMAAAVWLAWFQGKVTGPAPEDPDEREAMFRRGEMPNSVRVGDTWVSWRRWEPISLPLSIALSAFGAMERLEARQLRRNEVPTSTLHDMLSLATVASQAMVTNILDSSYFAGVAQFAQATQRGRETGDVPKGVLRQLATMITPWSGLQRAMIRSVDSLGAVPGVPAGQTVVRQPEGFWETLMNINIAGVYTEAGPPIRRDIFGQPLIRQTSIAGELLPVVVPPFERGVAIDDPVEQAFQRLRYFPGTMSKTDETGKAYPREMYHEMMRVRGELVKPRLDALVNSAGWDRLTPEQQRKAIQQRFSEAARQAKRQVQREFGEGVGR